MTAPTLSHDEALKQIKTTEVIAPIPETIEPIADQAVNQPPKQYPLPQAIIGARSKPDFPLHALPPLIREAVMEVQAYVQAPTALVVSSVLGIISVICQGLFKVRRDKSLVSPLSLYLLSVAEPNERKSKIESYFRPVIEKWLAATLKIYASKHHAYEAEMVAHDARHGAIEKAIKANDADGETIEKLTNELTQLIADAPEKPLSPKMLFGDATKEAISKSLDENYPSGGIISAEAGGILAGALTRDGLTGVLAMLNSLWSAETVTINRSGAGDRVLP